MPAVIFVADVNRWHGITDWPAYARFSPAVILKWTEGRARPRAEAVQQRDRAHRAGVAAVGLYHFWRDGISAADQAKAFTDAVGTLRLGEWAILDVEGAAWDARHEDFCRRVDAALDCRTWAYGGKKIGAVTRPLWVARYPRGHRSWRPGKPPPAGEPTIRHDLWQFTDHATGVPGQPDFCDLSVFHGALPDLLRLIAGSPAQPHTPAPTPAPKPRPAPVEDDMPTLVQGPSDPGDPAPQFLVWAGGMRHVNDMATLAAERKAGIAPKVPAVVVTAAELQALARARGYVLP
jgi:GH25 family lysozyme M1 (1,4-beta-N-acetylmuramidase)